MARLAGNVLPAQHHPAAVRPVNAADAVEQGGLAGAADPSREINSPCRKVRFTPSKITFSSKLFLMFSADKMSIAYAR